MPPLRVLYVEDDPDIRLVAQLSLEAVGGLVVHCCATGQEAIEIAEAFAPDLFVLDVMMPTLDGPATLARLRELPKLRRAPAVFMTAKVQPDEVDALRAVGALGIISKPFDPMSLPNQLMRLWNSRRQEE